MKITLDQIIAVIGPEKSKKFYTPEFIRMNRFALYDKPRPEELNFEVAYRIYKDTRTDSETEMTGNISLNNLPIRDLTKFLPKLERLNGNLGLLNCDLTSLKGCPKEVKSLEASGNFLKNLIGAPEKVLSELRVDNSELESLEGCPQCPQISLRNNKITDFSGLKDHKADYISLKENTPSVDVDKALEIKRLSGCAEVFYDRNIVKLISNLKQL